MGFLKDAGESLLNFSERFLDKTEELAQIARITMEIKKLEHSIKEIYLNTGKYVYDSVSSGKLLSNTDEFISGAVATINDYKAKIQEKQNEIKKIKELYESKHNRY
ncbi:MAG: hypothetical protein N3F66_01840 [Spirochaetes bacterium]|nr:hypothetical protein [Spirochaetota bacterium]